MTKIEQTQEPARVTFIVPCFNGTEWLADCLDSLINQSVTDWEAVIVDDGSADATAVARVVQSMGDRRFRLIRHIQNRGLAAARNTGIADARTEWIVCVDSDDLLVPQHLETTIEAIAKHQADAVFSDFQYFGWVSETVRARIPSAVDILVRQPVIVSGMLAKRSLWEHLGGFDESAALRLGREDTEFCVRLFNSAAKAVHVEQVLYLFRRWEKSLNRSCLRSELIPRFYIYTKHRHLYDSAGARNPFLTKGFEMAGRTALGDGHRWRAAVMAARSFRYGGSSKTLVLFLESIAPMPRGTFAVVRGWIGGLLRRLRPVGVRHGL